MSLSSTKEAAKMEVISILEDMMTRETNSIEEFTDRLFHTLENWLKQARIKYESGLTAGSNTVVGTFTGQLE